MQLCTHLAGVSRAARAAQPPVGLWPRSTADPDGPADAADLAALEQPVTWPKLFRRIVPYLAAGFPDFDGVDSWLRADPKDRDDELFLLDRGEHGDMHDVVRGAGQTIQLTVWPEDFIIRPDPAPVVPGPQPVQPAVAADVLLVAVLPDPTGPHAGAESVTLLNASPAAVDLAGWALSDAAGGRQRVGGSIEGGGTVRLRLTGAVQLSNQGDTSACPTPRAMSSIRSRTSATRCGPVARSSLDGRSR